MLARLGPSVAKDPTPPDIEMMTEAARLRQRAQWYRDFAKLGNLQEEAWRNQMADYFDRLADNAENDGTTEGATAKPA
jgi:hypothetical protein